MLNLVLNGILPPKTMFTKRTMPFYSLPKCVFSEIYYTASSVVYRQLMFHEGSLVLYRQFSSTQTMVVSARQAVQYYADNSVLCTNVV